VFGSKINGIGLSRGQNTPNNTENVSNADADDDEKGNKRERGDNGDDANASAGAGAGTGTTKKQKGGKGMKGEDFISLEAFASGDEMDNHGEGDAGAGGSYGDEEDGILKFRRDDSKSKDAKGGKEKGKQGDVAPVVQNKKAGNNKGKK
jgi:hypothetical protein